jgi:hypothetical protein
MKALLCLLFAAASMHAALSVKVVVKEPSGFAAVQYPISVMVPLPQGQYQDVSNFRLLNKQGTAIPAQFVPIARYAFQDNSVRFVQVHFFTDVAAKGYDTLTLQDNGPGPAPANAVTVSQTGNMITVNTGALKFTVNKSSFNLFDQLWLEPGDVALVNSTAQQGGRYTDLRNTVKWLKDRTIDTFAIEETGPVRTVIRLESFTQSQDSVNQNPGFVCRLYA